MILKFEQMETKALQSFNGGEGTFFAEMFVDENNKILRGKLVPGASIGLHRHVPTSETIFVVSGKGKLVCDGVEERVAPGDCHYCPKGSEHTFINDGDEDVCFFAVVPKH